MVLSLSLSLTIASKLSVLALSSRFDGPLAQANLISDHQHFQYSLCRVVLMVPHPLNLHFIP